MYRSLLIPFLFFLIPAYSAGQIKSLDFFIRQSLKNDPATFELQNQVLQNRIDSALIVAGNKFQVAGNGNAFYAPVINGYGYDEVITNGQQVAALVAVNKHIYNKHNLDLQFESLQLQNDSLNNSVAITEQDIKKSIVNQYIITYGEQLQLGVNTGVIDLLRKEEQILQVLTRKNIYKQSDYLSFLVTLQQQILAENQLRVQYKNDYAILNYLSGITDTTTETLGAPDLQLIRNDQGSQSPFFLHYKIDSLRIQNERMLAKAEYRPKLNVFADAGYQSALVLTPYKNFGYSFGISLTVPIFDGNQKQLQYAKLDIRERTLGKKQDFFYHQYRQQVEELEQQLHDLEGLTGTINKQIEYLDTLISVNGKLLETGDIRITDYVLALNNYITAKSLVIQNRIARFQVIRQLNYWNMKL